MEVESVLQMCVAGLLVFLILLITVFVMVAGIYLLQARAIADQAARHAIENIKPFSDAVMPESKWPRHDS